MIENHKRIEMTKNKNLASNARAESPADLSDKYLAARRYASPEDTKLRWHRGEWLRYDGKSFRPLEEKELKADIMNYFRQTPGELSWES
jgi:cytoplasmic iron level regulating protein YaaA (DUF328/UPF0246 family)